MSIALTLHTLAATTWVGGMFFAYVILRPIAAQQLEPPERLQLWTAVFQRFFPWVWSAITILPTSGYYLLFAEFGGFTHAPIHIHLMHGLGLIMIGIFIVVYTLPYKGLRHAVIQTAWPQGAKHLNRIRQLIAVNLALGILVIIVASAGHLIHASAHQLKHSKIKNPETYYSRQHKQIAHTAQTESSQRTNIATGKH